MAHPNKIIIAEKDTLIREAFCRLISSIEDVEVIGQAKDGEEAIKSTEELVPDLVVMGLDMPKIGGLEAIQEIKRRCPGVRILVLTAYEDERYVKASLKAGGNGYLLKDATFDQLVTAIRTVLTGEVYLDPSALKRVLETYLRESKSARPRQILSNRERQIVHLIVKGRRTLEIAKGLGISPKTVDRHRSNIMKKLDVHSVAALITLAVSEGISTLPKRKTLPSA